MPLTSFADNASSEPSALRRRVGRFVWGAAIAVLLLVPLAVFIWIERNHRGRDEVRALVKEAPLYPGFIQTNSTEQSKISRASVIVTYNIPAHTVAFEDVKNFYTQELSSKGWRPQAIRHKPLIGSGRPADQELIFSKGDYWITIAPGARISEYVVTYEWENPSY